MKITTDEKHNFVIQEAYNPVIFKTGGNGVHSEMVVQMRDNSFEFKVVTQRYDSTKLELISIDQWYRINPENGAIEKMR